MNLKMETYRAPDLDRLMTVWRAATITAHEFMGAAELDRDEALIRNEFIDKTETWTVRHDDEMVGFISLMGTRIVALFVDPVQHRRGIGSALMRHVNRLHGPLSVEVFGENTRGVSFYKKHGFKLKREEENSLYPGHPHWIMEQESAEE